MISLVSKFKCKQFMEIKYDKVTSLSKKKNFFRLLVSLIFRLLLGKVKLFSKLQ